MLRCYGAQPASSGPNGMDCSLCDINQNGGVGFGDLLLVLKYYGQLVPPPQSS